MESIERDDNNEEKEEEDQKLQSLFLFDEGSLLSNTASLSSAGLTNTKGQLNDLEISLKLWLKINYACDRTSLPG